MHSKEKQHWENIYSTKREGEVSWFQSYPSTSMEFINYLDLPADACIIDVGGGDSHLADALIEQGYKNIWVLDISGNAIDRAKKRLGEKAAMVNWIVSDITGFEPPIQFDLWHDRAAFHFLTTEEKICKYVSITEQAVKNKGYMILGTFSEQGPRKCSGLEIKQYSDATLAARFAASFNKTSCIELDHKTPSGTSQNFLFCRFQKK